MVGMISIISRSSPTNFNQSFNLKVAEMTIKIFNGHKCTYVYQVFITPTSRLISLSLSLSLKLNGDDIHHLNHLHEITPKKWIYLASKSSVLFLKGRTVLLREGPAYKYIERAKLFNPCLD